MAGLVVILTEKPSVARDIARATGHFKSQKDYLAGSWQGRATRITWALGHLCELAPPEAYHPRYKRWSLADLPIIPQQFRLQVLASHRERFQAVKALLTDPTVTLIVNACDAGREGELIFWQIYEQSGATAPVERLWLSSLTHESIRAGLAALRPAAEFATLAAAARLRSQADWLVGLNATRAVTKRGGELYSVGRVQTPTLALLVQREREIQQFTVEPFYQVQATFQAAAGPYTGMWLGEATSAAIAELTAEEGSTQADSDADEQAADETATRAGRLPDEAAAKAIVAAVTGQPGTVVKSHTRQRSQLPALLFDLTALQREMNQRYGFAASKTLALAQELYEKHKAITYPRTDSRFLTPDLVAALRRVLAAVKDVPGGEGAAALLARQTLPVSGRIVNAAKVTDHHAIIPTAVPPTRLGRDQGRVYEAIVRRFVAAFYPPASLATTRLWTEAGGHLFFRRATVVVEPGWLAIERGRSEAEEPLPPVAAGEAVTCSSAEVIASETRPPTRYTEATLLRAMETAGRHLADSLPDAHDLAAVLAGQGIGTPATRAAIIERLIDVGYVRREKKSLVPTDKGMRLIATLADTDLVSAALTGRWEQRLRAVERGEVAEYELLAAFVKYTRELVATLRELSVQRVVDGDASGELARDPLGKCPQCGGDVHAQRYRYACACSFSLPRRLLGQTLTPDHVRLLLAGKRTPQIKRLRSRHGTLFNAALSLDDTGKLVFHFPAARRRRTRTQG